MQGDVDSSMYEVVSTADYYQLLAKHAAGEELRCTLPFTDPMTITCICTATIDCLANRHT